MTIYAGIKDKSLGLLEKGSQNNMSATARALMGYSFSELEWLSLTQGER